MKKNIFLSTVALLSLGMLAGCGNTPATSSAAPSVQPSVEPSVQPSSEQPSVQPSSGEPGEKTDLGTIEVWCDQKIINLTEAALAEWLEENPQYTATFHLTNMSESVAASTMMEDPDNGADLYYFAQDQLARLISAGCLYDLTEGTQTTIARLNDEGSVAAVTVDGDAYAFPATSDNGYFMYYDKAFFQDVDMTDMDAIVARCNEENKSISFAYGNAWYNAAFFFGYGATIEYECDSDGNFVDYYDTYDSEEGLLAAQALQRYASQNTFVNDSSTAAFLEGAKVVISGTWDKSTAESALGENMGATILPRVRAYDGAPLVQLSSFAGFKLVGAKPQRTEARRNAIESIGLKLTSEDQQRAIFEQNGWGPSNKALQQDPQIASDEVLRAIFAQNALAKAQGQFPNGWWDLAGALGTDLSTGVPYAEAVDDYKAGLDATLD